MLSSSPPPHIKNNLSFSDHDKEEEEKILEISDNHHQVFSDDICFEIISMIDNPWFILNNCTLISKQFLNVIKERSKLVIKLSTSFKEIERIELFKKSQFIDNVVGFGFSWKSKLFSTELIKLASTMKQLRSLSLKNNEVSIESIALIRSMKFLTSIDITNIRCIGKISARDRGVKFIVSGMKNLTSLRERNNLEGKSISPEGAKSISETMTNLTLLDIGHNDIGDEGAKFISEMKNLTSLDVDNNNIGDKGAKFISEMKQLRSLNIFQNQIGSEGAKFISEMENLTFLDIRFNRIGSEGKTFIREMKLSISKPINCKYN